MGNLNHHQQTTMQSANPATVIIGGGKISEQHLSALQYIPDVHISAICDLSPALAQFTADKFNIPQWYVDYRKMLTTSRPDIVHVLTPPATHDTIVRDCLDHGCHVIVEKPIALSKESFSDLWNYATDKKLKIIENHNYRFNRPVEQLKKAITEGKIGDVEEIEIRISLNIRGGGRYADKNLPHPSHKLPAGIIHEFITHLSYLFLHFLPEVHFDNIDIINAAWRNHGADSLFTYDDLDAFVIAGPVHGRIRFSSRQWPDSFTITVRGSEGMGTAEIFHSGCRIIEKRPVGQHLTPLVNSLAEASALARSGFGSIWNKIRNKTAYEGLQKFLHLTYDALLHDKELPVTFDQMNETIQLVDHLLDEEKRI